MGKLLAAAAALAALTTACSVRRPPAFRGSYSLTRMEGADVLLAPTVPQTQPPRAPIAISVGEASTGDTAGGGARKTCSVPGAQFQFEARGKAQNWRILLPAVADFPALSGQEKMHADLDAFLNSLDALEHKGCLARGGGVTASSLVEESLPARPNEALFYTYRYRPGEGMIDLKPGMRVHIQRAFFHPGTRKYAGTTSVTYDAGRNGHGGVTFRRAAMEGKNADHLRARGLPYYRLFLLAHYVPTKTDRVAMIVGADTRQRMGEIANYIREHPDTACTGPLAAPRTDCVLFEGSVTVSPEIQITRNGSPAYLPAGVTVSGILGSLKPAEREAAWKTLRLERRFQGAWYPVEFDRGEKAIQSLVLAGGDRVSW